MTTTQQASNGAAASEPQWQNMDPEKTNVYVKPAQGLVVQGELLGRFPRFDGEGNFYQIKLTAPCAAKQEKKEVTAAVGTVINMDEKARLTGLAKLCGTNLKYAVRITFLEQKPTKRGGKVWVTKNESAIVGKHAPGQVTPDLGSSASSPATGSDEIPF